jgi:tetratricopeptide (TPR) repeat protein
VSPPFRLLFRSSEAAAGLAAGREGEPSPAERLLAAAAGEKEALAAFRKALRLEPGDPDYHYILGDALRQAGRPGDALPVLLEAVRLNPHDSSYHQALGAAQRELGRYVDAASSFGEAVRYRPEDLDALNGRGVSLLGAGNPREALAVFQAALGLGAGRADLHNNLGVTLWEMGQTNDALAAFRRAISIEATEAEAHRNLALALSEAGQPRDAVAVLRQVARLRPGDADGHLDLADALARAGDASEAERSYEEASRLAPGWPMRRPESGEIRQGLALQRLRGELRREGAPALARAAGTVAFAVGRVFVSAAGLPGRLLRGAVVAGVIAACYAGLAHLPAYADHYLLKDDAQGAARAPVRDDADVRERLMHAVRERNLEGVVGEDSFHIDTRPRWRVIRCAYRRQVAVLPGITRTLDLQFRVEEPYIVAEAGRPR